MSMEIDFEIPKSRKTTGDKEIIYEFSGDDDVWVFVDGKLALDIGGIHQPLGGKIDFTNGKVYVYNASGTVTETYSWDVGAHKLSMFYLERGGCDSNLSLKMNMPLILGPGDVELFKSGGTGHTGLQDAVFGIWEDAACAGEPYMVAVSDENGLVVKKNLPVRVEGQEFYIREILAPQGYTLDDTIYKATAGTYNAATGRYPFTTWYIKGLDHGSMPDSYPGIMNAIVYNNLDINSDENYPQFMKYNADDGSITPFTEYTPEKKLSFVEECIALVKRLIEIIIEKLTGIFKK
jgi:fibro-slime domain-containing protein